MASLVSLIKTRAPHAEFAAYLDDLTPAQRLQQTRTLSGKHQKGLYELMAHADPIDLEHFVPGQRGPLTEVIHHGKNTIPLPHAMRRFEKRFCLPKTTPYDAHTPRLFGFNEGFSRRFIGPGYFVAESTEGMGFWEAQGGVIIDYFQIPNQDVPSRWPKVVPNRQGLQRFVFDQTRDLMRKVSHHVSIGAAFRGQEEMGFYFVLCREDN